MAGTHPSTQRHAAHEALRRRISGLRSRGWINALEEAEHLQLLRVAEAAGDGDGAGAAALLEQAQRSLDFVEKRQQAAAAPAVAAEIQVDFVNGVEGTERKGDDAASRDGAAFPSAGVWEAAAEVVGGSDADAGDTPQEPARHRAERGRRGGSDNRQDESNGRILGTREVRSPASMSSVLAEPDGLRDLFVETCFFARLGFLQPPSCLRCAYRGARGGGEGKSSCRRLVVWRRDASEALHPERLGGTGDGHDGDGVSDAAVVVTTCHVARAWMKDETIEGLRWDRSRRKLVRMRDEKRLS